MDYHAWVFITVIVEVFIFYHRLYKYPDMFNAYIVIGNETGIGKKGPAYLVLSKKVDMM